MAINLQTLNYQDEIVINENIIIPDELVKGTEIVSLNEVKVKGSIRYDISDSYLVNLEVSGQMMVHDSLTYDEIPYSFTITIEENLENSLKELDLIEFLWHYIVLEIPLRYTLSDEVTNKQGDGYQVIDEELYENMNNPFKDFFKE